MDMDPVPILMSMVLFSNIGGTATPVGDPPNVIIASNRAVVQAVSNKSSNSTKIYKIVTQFYIFLCL